MSTFRPKPSPEYLAAVVALRRLSYDERAPAYAEACADEARALWVEREGVTPSASHAGWRHLEGERDGRTLRRRPFRPVQ